MRRHSETGPMPLAPHERRVLRELHTGASNKVIARRVKFTEGSVKVIVSRILDTLGLSNRVELALAVERNPALVAEPVSGPRA